MLYTAELVYLASGQKTKQYDCANQLFSNRTSSGLNQGGSWVQIPSGTQIKF